MHVQWTRPTFVTFGRLALSWGFSAGIVLGIAGFVESLFGVDTEVMFIIWRFKGITAGAVGLVAGPVVFVMLSLLAVILFPLFRLGVAVSKGVGLYFRAEGDEPLHFSRLQLRSYVKLSAIFGFLIPLFSAILLLVVAATDKYDDMSVPLVPNILIVSLVQHGVTTFTLAALAAPFLYGFYSAVLGLFAFFPFRLLTRLSKGDVLPYREVLGGDERIEQAQSRLRRIGCCAIFIMLCAMMLLLCAAMFSMRACPQSKSVIIFDEGQGSQRGTTVCSTSAGSWRLQWKFEHNQVRFLALAHDGDREPPELITYAGTDPTDQPMLSLPGREAVPCPRDFNVFELVDGHFDQRKCPLTVEQAKKYCNTQRDRYTIETLNELLKQK